MVPRLSTPGLLVAGDAGGFCYTNGSSQEGMNLAMTSGLIAAQVGAEALARRRLLRGPPGGYAKRAQTRASCCAT